MLLAANPSRLRLDLGHHATVIDDRDGNAAGDVDGDETLRLVRAQVQACRAAHDRLLGQIAALTDATARAPSTLPDWSVGHVLTHIARNGDSVVHLSRAVSAGGVADQYPGGPAQRTGDIEAGAGRPAAELVADVRAVNAHVHTAWQELSDDHWLMGQVRTASGRVMPASYLPAMRWREVVVHTSDLGLPGGSWKQWPEDFVAAELPGLLEMLAAGLDADKARALVAQLMGRRDEPLALPAVMW